ncbi:MAG: hypothetical protein ACYCW6_07775 [Candidatus Xenobia bacterium]
MLALWLLLLALLPLAAWGDALQPLANGQMQVQAPGVQFCLPGGFVEDHRTRAVDDPPYQEAFTSGNGKVEVRLQADRVSGPMAAREILVTATTYAMNRYGTRRPHDVFLAQGPLLPHATAECSVIGKLPQGSRWQAEKTIFIAAAPNRVYTITLLFQDGDLTGALQTAETVLNTLHLRP